MHARLAILSVLTWLAVGVDDAPAAGPQVDYAAVRGALATLRMAGAPSAHAALITDAEQVLFFDLGGTSGRHAAPLDADTIFRIGSITKTFTALATMLAVMDGALELDDTVEAHLGPAVLTNPWAASDPVRLVHLLEHTAGLADLAPDEMDASDPAPITLARALAAGARHRQVRWPPGRYFSYTNAGAGLVARAVEQATGRDFERFLRDRVLLPLGMTHASLHADTDTLAHLVPGYDHDGVTRIPYWHMQFRPFGALNVRPRQMAGLLQLLLARGRYGDQALLTADAITRMEQPTTTAAADSGLAFGYGLGLYAWYRDGVLFHGHGGDADGYLAHFGYSRTAGLAYFIVINAFDQDTLSAMRGVLERHIAARAGPTAVAPEPPLPPPLEALGTYHALTARFGPWPARDAPPMHLDWRDGGLYSSLGSEPARRLVRVSRWHWRRADEAGATIALLPADNGHWLFQGERKNYQQDQPRP